MGRQYDFSEKESEMYGRCINWGRHMAGSVNNLDLRQVSGESAETNGLDAALIEEAMLLMKVEKRQNYRLFRHLYLGQKSTIEASNILRKSEWWVRQRHREGLAFLIRHAKPLFSPRKRLL